MIITYVKYSEYFNKDVDKIFDFLMKRYSNVSHCILSTVEKFSMFPRYILPYFYNRYYQDFIRYLLPIPRLLIDSNKNDRLYDGLIKLPYDILNEIYSFINFDKPSKKIERSKKKLYILILDDIAPISYVSLLSLMYVV
jgi:hypothetical protein